VVLISLAVPRLAASGGRFLPLRHFTQFIQFFFCSTLVEAMDAQGGIGWQPGGLEDVLASKVGRPWLKFCHDCLNIPFIVNCYISFNVRII